MLSPSMPRFSRKPGQTALNLSFCACVCASVAFVPAVAQANPYLDGVRQLSLAGSGRASATGVDAILVNPSAVTTTQQFSIMPVYQYSVARNGHALGAFILDSLNNPRFGLGLGYTFYRAEQSIGYSTPEGAPERVDTLNLGHEVYGVLSARLFKGIWHLAMKPKWQYSVFQYRDDEGQVQNLKDKMNTFGLDLATTISILQWARVSVSGENLVGVDPVPWSSEQVGLSGIEVLEGVPLDFSKIPRVSGAPRTLTHSLAVFPLGDLRLSLNVDGVYDFTSYWDSDDDGDGKADKHTRLMYGGGVEFVAGPVPIRVGGSWDQRGPSEDDDRAYVGAGAGFVKTAGEGGVGWEVGLGFSQQVSGPRQLDTIIGAHIGLRLRPQL